MSTILVVDDEPSIRAVIRAALERAGHRLLEAADGAAALRMARSHPPDLIVLDIALPQLSGLKVCRQLKAEAATARTPVLLLTGLVEQTQRQAAAEAGAEGLITKPFSPAGLVGQIEDTLRRTASASR